MIARAFESFCSSYIQASRVSWPIPSSEPWSTASSQSLLPSGSRGESPTLPAEPNVVLPFSVSVFAWGLESPQVPLVSERW